MNISHEEYALLQSFKFQLEEKKKEFFALNIKLLEREEKLYERTRFYEREMKIAKERRRN